MQLNKHLTLRLDNQTAELLLRLSESQERKRADVVRRLIRQAGRKLSTKPNALAGQVSAQQHAQIS